MAFPFACLVMLPALCLAAQSPLEDLKAETDPGKRAEKALMLAESQFDAAKAAYAKGEISDGDTGLDIMSKALDETVASLAMKRKSRLYKRAEIQVAHLQRRLSGLVDDLRFDDRGWAEQVNRHLAEVHDKLLEGVMRK